jgi:hypothetical protein
MTTPRPTVVSSSSSSSLPQGWLEACPTLLDVLTLPTAETVEQPDASLTSALAGFSLQERQVVLAGIEELVNDDNSSAHVSKGRLYSFNLAVAKHSKARYTHIEDSGPALVVTMFLDHGDEYGQRTKIFLLLSVEVLMAHFSTNHPIIRECRKRMEEHNHPIDWLPLTEEAHGFRVYESTHVHCVMQEQRHFLHNKPSVSPYSNEDVGEEDEKEEEEEEEKKKRERQRKPKRRKKTGDDGPGLVFVRDALNACSCVVCASQECWRREGVYQDGFRKGSTTTYCGSLLLLGDKPTPRR